MQTPRPVHTELNQLPANDLAAIPLIETTAAFPIDTLKAELPRAHALLDRATQHVPTPALRALDAVSKHWLQRTQNPYRAEIETIAALLIRPGVYFFSVNYEWGCTCLVSPNVKSQSARLVRVLDWRTPGLGRNIIAARVPTPLGPFITLTWPGYTGVLSALAPGRFAAALNQAPMRTPVGVYALDWAANRAKVWGQSKGHVMPAHLLREVFEHAPNFAAARQMLIETPITTPAIFLIAGTSPSEALVIERTEIGAHVHLGCNAAANHWQAPGWYGRARGRQSAERAAQIHRCEAEIDDDFYWLHPPILNKHTRLVMVADALSGRLVAQGFENASPATLPLHI